MELVHLLSEKEIGVLRSLLGKCCHTLYTRSLEVSGDFAIAQDYSLSLSEDGYCVIESDWADTPQDWIDYHMIEVSNRDWPKRIARSRSKDGRAALGFPSSIRLRPTVSPFVKILILDRREQGESDSVHYDHALVFVQESGYRFALSAHESIAGGLEFTDSIQEIDTLLSETSERICLE